MLFTVVFAILCVLCKSAVIVNDSPPHNEQSVLMARYIMHRTDWVAIATISTQESIKGYPFVGLKAFSDGPVKDSTGIPYLYITPMDVSAKDIEEDNKVTIMSTLAETDYCKVNDLDPQDPRCARVFISGKFIKLSNSSTEYQFGRASLFARHPAMETWPSNHEFYVAKIEPTNIDVFSYYGGIKHITIEDYFNPRITYLINTNISRSSF